MNQLMFRKVMEATKMDELLESDGTYFRGLNIRMGITYYAVVRGKIPLEVAQIIYEKYPENEYGIRVEGGCNNCDPKEWAVDDKYENELKKIHEEKISSLDKSERYEIEQNKLAKRKDNKKYIKTYHIDTKEGLIVFITEMKDYYLRKLKQPETEVQKFDEILAETTEKIIAEINPTISAYEWMQGDDENRDNYNAKPENKVALLMKKRFRELVTNFDKSVNPFLDEDVELDKPINYIQKVEIKGDLYNKSDKKRKNCCFMQIVDKNKQDASTTYYRASDGFSFQMSYELNDDEYLSVLHYYTTTGNYKSDIGEVIAIKYRNRNNRDEDVDIRLNISNWRAGKTYEDKIPVGLNQLVYVEEKLIEATEFAKSITIANMAKQNIKVKN